MTSNHFVYVLKLMEFCTVSEMNNPNGIGKLSILLCMYYSASIISYEISTKLIQFTDVVT